VTPSSYSPGTSDREIILTVIAGEDDEATLKQAVESATAVSVTVSVSGDGPKDAENLLGWPKHVPVTLRDPLGARRVVDQDGNPIPVLLDQSGLNRPRFSAALIWAAARC
jgi:hypothetical protein